MARPRETAFQQKSLKAGPGDPLIAVPAEGGGTISCTSEEAARADQTDETLQAALDTAGAFSDLDCDETMDELDRIHHGDRTSSRAE